MLTTQMPQDGVQFTGNTIYSHGPQYPNQPRSAEQTRPITSELAGIHQSIDLLDQSLSILFERLSAVRHSPPRPVKDGNGVGESGSTVAVMLRDYRRRLEAMRASVITATEEMEL
jgi:hypothetical protein